MTVGIALGPYRVASLIWLVVLISAAVYVRRFGPRGVAAGLVMFNGGFLGFFLHAEIQLSHSVGSRRFSASASSHRSSSGSRFSARDLDAYAGPDAPLLEGRADRLLTLSVAVLAAAGLTGRQPWLDPARRQLRAAQRVHPDDRRPTRRIRPRLRRHRGPAPFRRRPGALEHRPVRRSALPERRADDAVAGSRRGRASTAVRRRRPGHGRRPRPTELRQVRTGDARSTWSRSAWPDPR